MFSWIIKNCRIVDGTGKQAYRADLGLKGKEIARLGNLEEESSEQILDGRGLVCAPGFIDSHSHSDLQALLHPREENKLSQGVTTEVAGNCGFSLFPHTEQGKPAIKKMMESSNTSIDLPWQWGSEYFAYLNQKKIGFNYYPLVGHGMLRLNSSGYSPVPADAVTLERMKELLRREMESGCRGFSTGLEYAPGIFSGTEELIELAKVAARYQGVYTSHLRNQSDGLLESIEEALLIGREAGIPVIISHLKAYGTANWGKVSDALEMMEKAREEGIAVMADFYPYEASSTTLLHELPAWAIAGEPRQVIERLSSGESRNRIKTDMEQKGELVWDRVFISGVKTEQNSHLVGKSIAEIANKRKTDPYESIFDLLVEEEGGVEAVSELMSADDVNLIAQSPFTVVGSDANALDIEKPFSGHPRNYGAFPRFFQRFVREKKLLSLETAVRKTSGLAAEFLGIKDRGKVLPGYKADLVLFDPETIGNTGTYLNPKVLSTGIAAAFVNGALEYDHLETKRNFHRDTSAGEILIKK